MTGNEVTSLLAYMSAAWPASEITENTARVWAKHLSAVPAEDALGAADVLIRDSEFFPSVAKFMEVVRPIMRRRSQQAELAPSPDDGRFPTNEEVRKIIAETKRIIAEKRAKVRRVDGLSTLGDVLEERF